MMRRLAISACLFSFVLVLSAGMPSSWAGDETYPFPVWEATTVSWLYVGHEGVFSSPVPLVGMRGICGVCWREVHDEYELAGCSVPGRKGWVELRFPRVKRVLGVGGVRMGDDVHVFFGTSRGLYGETFSWSAATSSDEGRGEPPSSGEDLLLAEPAQVLDAASDGDTACVMVKPLSRPGRFYLVLVQDDGSVKVRELGVKGEVLLGRLFNAGGTLGALVVSGKGGVVERLSVFPAVRDPDEEPVEWSVGVERLGKIDVRGRVGVSFDRPGDRLLLAYPTLDGKLEVAVLGDEEVEAVERPVPGVSLGFPFVDCSLDGASRPRVAFFMRTPDGGLQIRMAARRKPLGSAAVWDSIMVDRTMSKLSTPCLAVGSRRGRNGSDVPFLTYVLGPARAVLMAYPKGYRPLEAFRRGE